MAVEAEVMARVEDSEGVDKGVEGSEGVDKGVALAWATAGVGVSVGEDVERSAMCTSRRSQGKLLV